MAGAARDGQVQLFLTSSRLADAGVAHGFSLRTGGVSQGPFASLNLSAAVGDEAGAVEENLRRLARAGGVGDPGLFASARQVHGDRIVEAALDAAGKLHLGELLPETQAQGTLPVSSGGPGVDADAVVTQARSVAASVRVADCVPVLIAGEDGRAVAAAHSGWRGTRLGIAGRTARALCELGATRLDPSRAIAAIGPCIRRCCYEVSPELARDFRAQFGPEAADDPLTVANPHLDLVLCVRASLRAAGLADERIELVGGCTACEPAAYFSHRRDAGRTGRHLAFICARTGAVRSPRPPSGAA